MPREQKNPNQDQQSPKQTDKQSFDQLVGELKASVSRFQEDTSPENFAGIVSVLSRFGISGADLWSQVARYSKEHPLRVALGATVVFFAAKGLIKDLPNRVSSPTVH